MTDEDHDLVSQLEQVQVDYQLATAFNLWRMICHNRNRAGPTVRPLSLLWS